MAFFRRHDAAVALREVAETGIAVTLTETFPSRTTTMNALDLLQILDSDIFAEPVIQRQLLATQFEPIVYRAAHLGQHFVQVTLSLHISPFFRLRTPICSP